MCTEFVCYPLGISFVILHAILDFFESFSSYSRSLVVILEMTAEKEIKKTLENGEEQKNKDDKDKKGKSKDVPKEEELVCNFHCR